MGAADEVRTWWVCSLSSAARATMSDSDELAPNGFARPTRAVWISSKFDFSV